MMNTKQELISLYEADETAWLEEMSALVRNQRWSEIDVANLSEYLCDMAKRDRRETFSRLVTLLIHLLKWEYQAGQRTASWRRTSLEQQRELEQILESGTLRRHAEQMFHKAYERARKDAASEADLDLSAFPASSPWSLEQVLTMQLTAGN